MSKAFARQLVTDNEMTQINAIMKKYYAESIDAVNRIGKDGPTTFNKHGIVNETKLKALAEALKEVQANSVYGKSELMTKQFLYNLLAPKLRKKTYDIVGYDATEKRSRYVPSFMPNKNNEKLVFAFLDRAKIGEAIDMSVDMGKRLHKDIVDNHMKAYIIEYNPALTGDVFKFQGATRDARDGGILPMPKVLPEWVLDPNLNNTAKNIMISYLNGSYFMDPVELYRATYNLYGNKINEIPNSQDVIKFMNESWQGVGSKEKIDPDGFFFNSKSIYENGLNFPLQKKGKSNTVNEMREKWLPKGDC